MHYIKLGKTDVTVSQLGLGCIDFGTITPEATCYELMDHYLENGGNLLDTANNYAIWHNGIERTSERVIGRYLAMNKGIREKIVLCTKLGALSTNTSTDFSSMQGCSAKVIFEEVEKSLDALQTSYIDLLYLHIDDRHTPLEETLGSLNEVIKKGYVKHIGCSNFRTWRIEEARHICEKYHYPFFSAVQQRYSYLQPIIDADFGVQIAADSGLADYIAHYQDLTMVSHTSLLYGAYLKAQITDPNYQTQANKERLQTLLHQEKDSTSWVLNYITKQFGGAVALFTSHRTDHLIANMKAL